MNEAEIRESERDAVRDRVAKVLLTELNHPDNARRSKDWRNAIRFATAILNRETATMDVEALQKLEKPA